MLQRYHRTDVQTCALPNRLQGIHTYAHLVTLRFRYRHTYTDRHTHMPAYAHM